MGKVGRAESKSLKTEEVEEDVVDVGNDQGENDCDPEENGANGSDKEGEKG